MKSADFVRRLERIFSIDVRALAVVRISLGIIVVQDLIRRSFDLVAFYGDRGVFPTSYITTFWTGEWAWSVHAFFGGHPAWVGALFIVHILATLAFLIGFRTRIATVIVWFLTVSLHNLNPIILQGEDVLLRVTLFVLMFLPIGAAYSWDRLRSAAPQQNVVSGWTVAYLLQLGFLYYFVSLYKHSTEWYNGTAAYFALSIDQYATSFGKWLLQFPDVLSVATISILLLQTVALFLLFSPFFTVFLRSVTVILLMIMHASFALSMHLAMFSFVSIAALFAFFPSEIWDRIERLVRRFVGEAQLATLSARRGVALEGGAWAAASSLVGVLYIIYVFFWHVGNVNVEGQYVPYSHGFEIPAKALRLDQRWNLFAPYPYRHDGWIIIAATLPDGERIDLFRDGAPLTFEKPASVFDIYPAPRWRRLFLTLWLDRNSEYRPPLAQYYCRSANAERAVPDRVESIEIIYMVEWTPAPGEAPRPVRPVTLIEWDCAKDALIETQEVER